MRDGHFAHQAELTAAELRRRGFHLHGAGVGLVTFDVEDLAESEHSWTCQP
jgi:hypothetical protein